MGQRHQIYVVRKNKSKYAALSAHHHQWCYGLRAASNVVRLASAIQTAKMRSYGSKAPQWEEYAVSEQRYQDVLVKAIYGIDPDGSVAMVHDESEHLIDSELRARPEMGDNNDGAALVVIDEDKKELRLCLFTPGHMEGKNARKVKPWKVFTPEQYTLFYYDEEELAQPESKLDPRLCTVRSNSFSSVSQAEFNKIFKDSIKQGDK